MKQHLLDIALLLMTLILSSCGTQTIDVDLAIINTNIVDSVARKILTNQTILIKDGAIKEIIEVGEMKLDLPDSLIINGENKYVISGFWNMHTHVSWKDDLDKKLFLIILNKNPVADIRNTLEISTVIRNGSNLKLSLTKPELH